MSVNAPYRLYSYPIHKDDRSSNPSVMSSQIRHPFQQVYSFANSNTLDDDDDLVDDALIPDIPSWSSSLILDTFQPHPRHFPRDVTISDAGETTWDERPIAIDVIDSTSLGISFDRSCLDSLEDRLLLHPFEAFADICWNNAVYDEPDRAATPTAATPTTPVQINTGLYTARRHSEDESEDDSCSDEDPTTPVFDKSPVDSDDFKLTDIYYKIPTLVDLDYDFNDLKSFIVLDPTFNMSNPLDSVNHFPVPTRLQHRTNLPSRFMTFCSKFPTRLRTAS